MKKILILLTFGFTGFCFGQVETRLVEFEIHGTGEKVIAEVEYSSTDVIKEMDVIIFEEGLIITPSGVVVGFTKLLGTGLGAGAQVFTGNGPTFARGNPEG